MPRVAAFLTELVDVVVQVRRDADGFRRVSEIWSRKPTAASSRAARTSAAEPTIERSKPAMWMIHVLAYPLTVAVAAAALLAMARSSRLRRL